MNSVSKFYLQTNIAVRFLVNCIRYSSIIVVLKLIRLVRRIKGQILVISLSILLILCSTSFKTDNEIILSYTVNPQKLNVKLYWKNEKGQTLQTFSNLRKYAEVKGKKLLFAMNGGMYQTDFSPLGLYIENGVKLKGLNTRSGKGNFYLKPNGVLYLNEDNNAFVCTTENFKNNGKVKYATQSGPMLLVNGKIHSAFKKGSKNVNIRNGVGILPDQTLLFAISKKAVNFYDFAVYFKKMGCKNALYLDGYVSRVYLPEKKWIQLDGNFGVMIGVTK